MNIFVIDECPVMAARMLCDKHVVKMVTESTQLLSTALRDFLNIDDNSLYKSINMNRPLIESTRNLDVLRWTYYHTIALLLEYKRRYKRGHACRSKIWKIRQYLSKLFSRNINKEFIEYQDRFHKSTDNDLQNVVENYRKYYRNKYQIMDMRWKTGNKPEFMGV